MPRDDTENMREKMKGELSSRVFGLQAMHAGFSKVADGCVLLLVGLSDTNECLQLTHRRVCIRSCAVFRFPVQPVHDYGYLIHEFDPWSAPQNPHQGRGRTGISGPGSTSVSLSTCPNMVGLNSRNGAVLSPTGSQHE